MFWAAGILLKQVAVLVQDRLDELAQVRLVDVLVRRDRGSSAISSLGSYWLLSTRSKKSIAVLGVFLGGRANPQDLDLHAVAEVVLAANLRAGRRMPSVQDSASCEEAVVVPEHRLVLHSLVAEEALEERLVALRHPRVFLTRAA